nr:uncharacterized protein LOC111417321 [Onthophagus taurus]
MESVGRLPDPMKFEGNLNEYFKRFLQKLEMYLIASERDMKPDKIKIAILLNTIGNEGIEIYNTFKFTDAEKDKYDVVVDKFKKYCAPRKNRTYERFVFNNRVQDPDEPFDSFLGDLKKLVQSCEYEDQEESIIVDRIILGTKDVRLQEKLLNYQMPKLEDVIEMCRNAEITRKHMENVRNKDEAHIDAIKKRSIGKERKEEKKNQVRKCHKCNKSHNYGECPAYGQKCFKCGKQNHFTAVCKTNIKKVREVTENEYEITKDEDEKMLVSSLAMVGEITIGNKSTWMEKINIEGKWVQFKVDTGSEVNIIPMQIIPNKPLQETKVILEAYGGTRLKPEGKIKLNCAHKSEKIDLEFLVINRDNKYCHTKEKFIQENIDVFEGLGTFNDLCKINLKANSVPVAKPCRRVPLIIKKKLYEKLQNLERQKIIAKVTEASEWVNPLIIVEKLNKSLRLCLDPHELNKCVEREFFEMPSLEDLILVVNCK